MKEVALSYAGSNRDRYRHGIWYISQSESASIQKSYMELLKNFTSVDADTEVRPLEAAQCVHAFLEGVRGCLLIVDNLHYENWNTQNLDMLLPKMGPHTGCDVVMISSKNSWSLCGSHPDVSTPLVKGCIQRSHLLLLSASFGPRCGRGVNMMPGSML